MENILHALGTPQMIAALEANLEEEMMSFGRALPGGEIYSDGEVEGFFTGRGHLNGILRTHLKTLAEDHIRAEIETALRYFRERQVAKIGWSVGQNCQPANMALYLEQHGFQKLDEENVGMALDAEAMHVEERPVEGLEIKEIADVEGLEAMRKLEIEGFDSSAEMAGNYCEMYAGAGFGPGAPWRHFIGWSRAEAVASTSLLFHTGVAGIYGVATVPGMRRRGIARALVLHAIKVARQEGYRIVILSPTDMSEGIYRRLGFRDYTCIRHYRCTL